MDTNEDQPAATSPEEGEATPDPGTDQDEATPDPGTDQDEATPDPGTDQDESTPDPGTDQDESTPDPGTEAGGGPTRVYFAGVEGEARDRLLELPVLEPVAGSDEADLVVLSTRLRRSEVSTAMSDAKVHKKPVVVLAHTGGEATAVEMMRGGGAVVIAEGNESSLLDYLEGGATDSGMLETYERRVGSASSTSQQGEATDAVTGLPGLSAFEERVEQLNQTGELPRLMFLRVLHLDAGARMSEEATTLLRRRLGLQYLALARTLSAELFSLREGEFALIAVGLSPNRAEHLALQMSRVTESFAPSGALPLSLAVGHAGPEVAMEMATLRELASRASMVAAEAGVSRVVGADSLSLGLAATTELEAALRIIEVVERNDIYESGHGARMATLAHDIARQLGFEPAERTQVRLAAHLADIGMIGLPPAAMGDPETMKPFQRTQYESHPQRGAEYLRTAAGEMVAEAIAAHHERWDGSGFPTGASGNDIPFTARIIAVADQYELLTMHRDTTRRVSRAAALERLREQAGQTLDPAVVEVAVDYLSERSSARAGR